MPPVNASMTTNIIRFHLKSPADPADPLNDRKKASAQGSVPLISSLFFFFFLPFFPFFSFTLTIFKQGERVSVNASELQCCQRLTHTPEGKAFSTGIGKAFP